MSRSIRLYLEDIMVSGNKILSYTQAMTYEDFIADQKTYDAVIMNLLIIGEAVKNIPAEIKEEYKDIEWHKIAGLRDILAHAYFSLDDEIIWDIIINKIHPLLESIQAIINTDN
ncbi:HepT-like ribonuclease domain-containing protein [Crocosphaera sp.]|uniref:HepT-like ribonuclease domain-containing protein n=1 Tax=Crocosphaera sp. TaxID=2729996 RepID=UPI003F2498E4|nr:DUF86 domain-containing protein [Crocosphaera sp.]